jgi:hypothetical protein
MGYLTRCWNRSELSPNQTASRSSTFCFVNRSRWERLPTGLASDSRILSDAGLVEVRPDAQRRIYALRAQPFQEIDGWLERYRSLFAEQFERLDRVLEELQASKKQVKQKPKPARRRR